jgi:hypothetical protein
LFSLRQDAGEEILFEATDLRFAYARKAAEQAMGGETIPARIFLTDNERKHFSEGDIDVHEAALKPIEECWRPGKPWAATDVSSPWR